MSERKRPECPTCGEAGDDFHGTAKAAQLHFFRRTIRGLHELRRAAEADGGNQLAQYASALIRELEEMFALLYEERRH
jgi:hypothetical protein